MLGVLVPSTSMRPFISLSCSREHDRVVKSFVDASEPLEAGGTFSGSGCITSHVGVQCSRAGRNERSPTTRSRYRTTPRRSGRACPSAPRRSVESRASAWALWARRLSFGPEEVGRIEGVGVGTVKSRIARAREKLLFATDTKPLPDYPKAKGRGACHSTRPRCGMPVHRPLLRLSFGPRVGALSRVGRKTTD